MRKDLPKRKRLDLLFQEKGGQWLDLLLFPLVFISWIYGIVIHLRHMLYRVGIFKSRRLPCRCISVGNITLGGTGKTPLVITLAKELQKRGITVGILSRGYKGIREKAGGVVSDGKQIRLTPVEAGDEPFLLASKLAGVPVVVGKKRYAMGISAHEQFGMDCLILDDGFQHLGVQRDTDIVLIDARRGFGNNRLFPRGPLREPLRSLRRASMLLLTKTAAPQTHTALEKELRTHAPAVPLYHSRYKPAYLLEAATGRSLSPAAVSGKRVFAFAGVADPEYFVHLLKELGASVVKAIYFPDHYAYELADLTMLRAQGKRADVFITTEKDFVKLQRLPLHDIPLYILGIEQEIVEEKFFQELVAAISS
jgi:tetraacyldisaccharide 4'-kinase